MKRAVELCRSHQSIEDIVQVVNVVAQKCVSEQMVDVLPLMPLLFSLTIHVTDKARRVASLPMRTGGLGLRSARFVAPGSYRASCAYALHVIHEQRPEVTDRITAKLHHPEEQPWCIREVRIKGWLASRDQSFS